MENKNELGLECVHEFGASTVTDVYLKYQIQLNRALTENEKKSKDLLRAENAEFTLTVRWPKMPNKPKIEAVYYIDLNDADISFEDECLCSVRSNNFVISRMGDTAYHPTQTPQEIYDIIAELAGYSSDADVSVEPVVKCKLDGDLEPVKLTEFEFVVDHANESIYLTSAALKNAKFL